MDRERMLATIDALYKLRVAGETAPMAQYLAEGSTFKMIGESPMRTAFSADGAVDFLGALDTLNNSIKMHRIELKEAVAEGNQVAARWLANVQLGDRAPFDTEICNIWTFDDYGKIAKLREFIDTATLEREVAALQGG